MEHLIHSIGTVSSPYTQKFGIPRQSQRVMGARCCLVLDRSFSLDSVRGLDDFDYIWVQFIFHAAIKEGWDEMVRPPKLGGKEKKGVFATRSPHRPNHLGLSLLKIESIFVQKGQVHIECSGIDLLDGTPVVDIKPYLPFTESHANAKAGFTHPQGAKLNVSWLLDPEKLPLSDATRVLIEHSIAEDPRPAYLVDPQREYGMAVAGWNVRFVIADYCATIIACETMAS